MKSNFKRTWEISSRMASDGVLRKKKQIGKGLRYPAFCPGKVGVFISKRTLLGANFTNLITQQIT